MVLLDFTTWAEVDMEVEDLRMEVGGIGLGVEAVITSL